MSLELKRDLRTPDLSSATFGVEIAEPKLLYRLLSRDHIAHSYTLDSNWESIGDPNFDLFRPGRGEYGDILSPVEITSNSELKSTLFPEWKDRTSKVYWLEARVICRQVDAGFEVGYMAGNYRDEYAKTKLMELQKTMHWEGFDLVPPRYSSFPVEIVGEEKNNPVRLQHLVKGCDFDFVQSYYTIVFGRKELWPHSYKVLELGTEAEFVEHLYDFKGVVYRVIKALYSLEGKELPPAKLIFFLNLLKNGNEDLIELMKEYYRQKGHPQPEIVCSYCQSLYEDKYGSCPHCGGPRGG